MITDAASLNALLPHRGRPRKFDGPSRAVTLTLPEDVVGVLSAVDPDLSRAVVRIARSGAEGARHAPAELSTFGRRAVILVNPSRTLEERTGVVLVPLPDGRALISFDESLTTAELELVIHDALQEGPLGTDDKLIFEGIAELLRSARRSPDVVAYQRNIIVIESNPAPRKRRPAGRTRQAPGSKAARRRTVDRKS